MAEKVEVFSRSDVEHIVGLDYAVVKNWSTGKPIAITPSVYAPGKRGTQSLYSRSDLYFFALAKRLSELGFALEAVGRAFKKVRTEWLDDRGSVILARLNTQQPVVDYLQASLPPDTAAIEYARKVMLLLVRGEIFTVIPLAAILQRVDKNISELKGHRANEEKSR